MDEMNNAELTKDLINTHIETIAKLVKAGAKTVDEAVAIIKDCKLK